MKKSYLSVVFVIALCHVNWRGYSQEYVSEPNHDRAGFNLNAGNPLALALPGANYLQIVSPGVLEVVRITADGDTTWNFDQIGMPAATKFQVTADGSSVNVSQVGFKRRPLYAPLAKNDLRKENTLYLKLQTPLPSSVTVVEVKNSQGDLWPVTMRFIALNTPLRYGPAIHVNQEGYLPDMAKNGMVGYFLGNLGEMQLSPVPGFDLVDPQTGLSVFHGTLSAPRPDTGWPTDSNTGVYQPQYQQVLQADFSSYITPGKYVLRVDGLGASFPFRIDDNVAMKLARAYALGLYHQRCGGDGTSVGENGNKMPFTRFEHDRCHTAPAAIPNPTTTPQFPSSDSIKFIEKTLLGYSGAYDVQLFPSIGSSADLPTKGSLVIIIGRLRPIQSDSALHFRIFDGVPDPANPGSGTMRVDAIASTFSKPTQVQNLKNYLNNNGLWNDPNSLTGDNKLIIADNPGQTVFGSKFGVRAIVSTDGMLYPEGASTGDNPPQRALRMQTLSTILAGFKFARGGDGTAVSIDVSKGHHDAGDYSKYMPNSPQLIHTLIFAADNFPGAGDLKNLGIPESGGTGDLLALAKWEADFLVKMQDTDGGFYFLVYPQTREYESDKLPQNGDPQIVFPKTSMATAAAVGALAEIGSSPKFIAAYGDTIASSYRAKALLGWNYLLNLIGTHDENKAEIYQKITHYGDDFTHDDELAWAAAAMFASTGNDAYFQKLRKWYPHPNYANNNYQTTWTRTGNQSSLPSTGNLLAAVVYVPNTANVNDTSRAMFFRVFDVEGDHFDRKDEPGARNDGQIYEARANIAALKQYLNQWAVNHPEQPSILDQVSKLVGWCHDTRRWGWWRMFTGYGDAVRDLAFAVRSQRLAASAFDPVAHPDRSAYLNECNNEIVAAATDVQTRSEQNAYGTSLPFEAKGIYLQGWYFSSDWAFDIAVSVAKDMKDGLTPNAGQLRALIENFNYESGRNPVNVTYITGLGSKRQREIVDQYAQNDTRVLPPSGIPLGNISDNFVVPYDSPSGQLNPLCFPQLTWGKDSFALYDRWSDAWNAQTEFISVNSARALASATLLAASRTGASDPWSPATATIQFPISNPTLNSPAVAQLSSSLDLSDATIVWEAEGQEPNFGNSISVGRSTVGESWVEAEATLPDGRRVFSTATVLVNDPAHVGSNFPDGDPNTIALYHFDDISNPFKDSGHNYNLTSSGNGVTLTGNTAWMQTMNGKAVRFHNYGDYLTTTIAPVGGVDPILPNTSPHPTLQIDFRFYPRSYGANGNFDFDIFSLIRDDQAKWEIVVPQTWKAANPTVTGPQGGVILPSANWNVALNTWHHVQITLDSGGASHLLIDETAAGSLNTAPAYGGSGAWTLTLGNFDGEIDELRISR